MTQRSPSVCRCSRWPCASWAATISDWLKLQSHFAGSGTSSVLQYKTWWCNSFTDLCSLQPQQEIYHFSRRYLFVRQYCHPSHSSHLPPCWWEKINCSAKFVLIACAAMAVPPVDHLTGCSSRFVSGAFAYCLVPIMVAEAILCSCMVWKAWSLCKHALTCPILSQLVIDRWASML